MTLSDCVLSFEITRPSAESSSPSEVEPLAIHIKNNSRFTVCSHFIFILTCSSYKLDADVVLPNPSPIRVDRNSLQIKKGEAKFFRFLARNGTALSLSLTRTHTHCSFFFSHLVLFLISISLSKDVKGHRNKKGLFDIKICQSGLAAGAKGHSAVFVIAFEIKEKRPRREYKVSVGREGWGYLYVHNGCLFRDGGSVDTLLFSLNLLSILNTLSFLRSFAPLSRFLDTRPYRR